MLYPFTSFHRLITDSFVTVFLIVIVPDAVLLLSYVIR